ncbi:MAG: hypothetical protein RLZZ622_1373 [Planctomycetota bacterium]
MAKKTASAIQALTISLIIFVMLTFVLAVTTYVFFAQKQDAVVASKAANEAASTAQQKQRDAEKAQQDMLKDVIGADDGQTVEDIKAELTGMRDKIKGSADENTTPEYRSLVKTLDAAIQKANDDNKSLNEEKRRLQNELDAAKKGRVSDQAKHDDQFNKKVAELKAVADARKQMNDDFEKRTSDLNRQLEAANEKAERLQSLEDKIRREAGPFVAIERRDDFEAAGTAADQVAILLDELKLRDQVIRRQNEVLGAMRIADPSLQDAILAATPADDRIDGFDGRIVLINELEQSVLINFPRTIGIRPGMLFFVYTPGDQLPLMAEKKGILEIVAVESGTTARGRVLNTSTRDPILLGDGVATSLWSPLRPLEVVVVGHVQLDRDSAADTDRLEALIAGVGGQVAETVSHSTSLVVDAGEPRQVGEVGGRDDWTDQDKARRLQNLTQAAKLGVKVVRIDGFLELFGLEQNYFEADYLVTPTP